MPPSLQNVAARLATVGVTPLRKEAIGARLATGFLQEHDTLTQWVRAQSLTGHSKREALTEARALERGVADYGVGFLTSSSAEILLRRILALAIRSGTGPWQIAEKIEELPTESPLSCVPELLLKEIGASSPMASDVYASFLAFRAKAAEYAKTGDLAALKMRQTALES